MPELSGLLLIRLVLLGLGLVWSTTGRFGPLGRGGLSARVSGVIFVLVGLVLVVIELLAGRAG